MTALHASRLITPQTLTTLKHYLHMHLLDHCSIEAKLGDNGIDFLALQQSRLHVSAQAGDFQGKTRELGKAAKERCLKVGMCQAKA